MEDVTITDVIRDYAFEAGKADGEHDAKSPNWLDWLTSTFEHTPRNLAEPDRTQYLAGYLIGMAERVHEMAKRGQS